MEYNFRKCVLPWKISKSKTSSNAFCSPFQIYSLFKYLTLKNRSRSRSTTFAVAPFDDQCQYIKIVTCIFCVVALTVSKILTFRMFDLEK